MAWLDWMFGKRSPTVEQRPAAAGSASGQAVDLAPTEEALARAGFRLHDAARCFLSTHAGMAFHVPIAGSSSKGFVEFSPENVLRFLRPDDLPLLSSLMPEEACPVGTTSGHTMFIFLDEEGRSFLLDMEWLLFAELAQDPAEMLRVLCDGRNGRVDSRILDDQGRPTGEMIREGDERQHWDLAEFPALAPYLPPVSLSPLRRPPTQRAMVRSVEALMAQSGRARPAGLWVGCGGLTRAGEQFYFVAHCENCLHVRAKAGLVVLPSPKGVKQRLHVGEVLPVDPPSPPGGRS